MPGVFVVAQKLTIQPLPLTLKDKELETSKSYPDPEVPKILINIEMNKHTAWVASPILPVFYLHFIIVY